MTSQETEIDHDEQMLNLIGYKGVLYRGLTGFTCFCISFTSVGIIPSIAGLLPFAMSTGGPVILFWSWIIGSIIIFMVAYNMAKLCAIFPQTGSVYHWAACLATEKTSPFWSYVTGWFNVMGNIAGDAFFAYSFSHSVNNLLYLNTGEELSTQLQTIISFTCVLVWALMNLLRVDRLGYIAVLAAFIQLIGGVVVIYSLFKTCPTNISTQGLLYQWYNGTGTERSGYVALMGTLTVFFSITGFEDASHLSEETIDADTSASTALWTNVLLSACIGFVFVCASIYGVLGVGLDVFIQEEYGIEHLLTTCAGQNAGIPVASLITIMIFFAGYFSMTSSSRIVFAMARDGAFITSKYLKKVSENDKIPYNAILFVFITESLLLVMNLLSTTAFISMTTLSVIGYQVSYAIPILLRAVHADYFIPSAWFSGSWFLFTSFLFMLPVEFPITKDNMNYTSAIMFVVLMFGGLHWIFSAQYWFKGPIRYKPSIMLTGDHHGTESTDVLRDEE